MSVSTLAFTKSWENASDFPTVETSESAVRSDIQLLHNETKAYLNETIVPEVNRLGNAVSGATGLVFCTDTTDMQSKTKDITWIYVDKSENTLYRWTGTAFVQIAGSASGSYLPLTGGTLTGLVTGTSFKIAGSSSTAVALTKEGDYIGLYDPIRQVWLARMKVSDPTETPQFVGNASTATNCTNANKVFVQSTEPTANKAGDIWIVTG